jgi:hypothetical protein
MVIIFSPVYALAQVAISEVMYDPAGTDTKREWIEVCNVSSSSIDLTTFKLFESGSNHSIVAFSGGSSLEAGQCGVLADDPASFKVDYPSFSGALFDSSFSLSNSGEQLILRSAADADIDVTTYPATAAKGDGNTLHRSGSTYAAASASPGSEVGFAAPISGGGTDTGNVDGLQVNQNGNTATPASGVASVINFQTVTVEPTPKLTVRITVPEHTVMGVLTKMTAEAYNTKGQVVKAQIKWTFGDGTSASGSDVRHAFLSDGAYAVHVEATTDGLNDTAVGHIEVVPLSASLGISADGKVVSVTNATASTLDLTAWKLRAGSQYYIFPDNTLVLPQTTVKFVQSVTKLTEVVHVRYVELLSASSERVADAHLAQSGMTTNTTASTQPALSQEPFTVNTIGLAGIRHEDVPLPAQATVATHDIAQAAAVTKFLPEKTAPRYGKRAKQVLPPSESTKLVDVPEGVTEVSSVQAAATASSGFGMSPWYAGIVALVLLALAPVLLAQPTLQTESVASLPEEVSLGGLTAKDFEIIEVDGEGKVHR